MKAPELTLVRDGDTAVEWRCGTTVLLRYVHRPDTPLGEATRPYAHPVCSLAGSVLTNFRPNDHHWHHALSFTIDNLSGLNFWGGPTYRPADGYQWRNNHGTQHHVAWRELSAARAVETLEWRSGAAGEALLSEVRTLTPEILDADDWTLRWQTELRNVSGRELVLANYHSGDGLVGSHYTGLQFRGARALLDEHGDKEIGLRSEAGDGEQAVHGRPSTWMEWRGQLDTTLRRVAIRFENATGPLHWFVRRHNPLAAFPFQFERNVTLAPGESLALDHRLTFKDL